MRNILILIIVLSAAACNSDNEFEKTTATIFDSGDPALDGCGWLVVIDEELFKPLNLPSEFEEDGLVVEITYKILKKKGDCDTPNSIRQIHIKKIAEN